MSQEQASEYLDGLGYKSAVDLSDAKLRYYGDSWSPSLTEIIQRFVRSCDGHNVHMSATFDSLRIYSSLGSDLTLNVKDFLIELGVDKSLAWCLACTWVRSVPHRKYDSDMTFDFSVGEPEV